MLARTRAHPRAAALAIVATVLLGVLAVAAARSRGGGGCAAPPPVTHLPGALRALGDFDQPYDPQNPAGLQDAAQRAASAVHPDLAGQTVARPGDPVTVRAAAPATHDALVVPLLGGGGAGTPPSVWGLVDFLADCSGQLHLDQVVDLYRSGRPPARFPDVGAAEADATLGTTTAELVYVSDPLAPSWRDPSSGRTLPATLAQPPAPSFPVPPTPA